MRSSDDRWGFGRDWARDEPAGYPDPAWELLDTRFDGALPHAPLRRLWTGGAWTEGPVWLGDTECVLFSDIPNNRVMRWCADDGRVSTFDAAANHANGHARDLDGRIVRCENATRSVIRIDHDGTRRTLAASFDGRRLNAPNDVSVGADGALWFSDPTYGINGDYEGSRADAELPTRVYRIDPSSGQLAAMLDDVVQPNGLCFSPDGRTLYVADSGGDVDRIRPDGTIEPRGNAPGPRHILAFDVDGGRPPSHPRVFADLSPGIPDGIRCDRAGRVWSSVCWGGPEHNGVLVLAADGSHLARLHLPECVANIEFGGRKRNTLFITASRSLYSITVNASGP